MDSRISALTRFRTKAIVFLSPFLILNATNSQATSLSELSGSSLEELLSQEVTSVSRKQENLYTAPAAVYVITAEDIRRRGVTNLPEALTMAPGLIVRAITGNKWSIGARGHSGVYSNKLLVQIDGRSIYTPTFSGVYWDQHNISMSEIERIEVIRGSGATLWGANAVNGIINIITKHASDSQGGHLEAFASNQEDGSANIRYGAKIGDDTYFRINALSSISGTNTQQETSEPAHDRSKKNSIGFRLDGSVSTKNTWELSGGYHNNEHEQTLSLLIQQPPAIFSSNFQDTVDVKSAYLKGNWSYFHENGAQNHLQFFIDHYDREEAYLAQDLITYDLDYQLTFPSLGNHSLIVGAGYRLIDADYDNTYAVSILPNETEVDLYSAFIQDEYTLIEDQLTITVGSKFEHHDYTGWEVQPNIRMAFTPSPGHFTWAAISKAVRTPSIAERGSNIQGGVSVPVTTWVQGSNSANTEDVISYEIGYRYFSSNVFTFDTTVFYNEYDEYRSFETANPIIFQMDNKLFGKSYGIEFDTVWQPTANWQVSANYSYLTIDMNQTSDSTDQISMSVIEGSYAENMLKLHSAWDITQKWSLDTWVTYIDDIPVPSNYSVLSNIGMDDVINANARLSWRAMADLELALTAKNIFDDRTLESVGESFSNATEIDRSLILSLAWDF